MKTFIQKWGMTIGSAAMGLIVAVSVSRCGSSSGGGGTTFGQIEQLARPGINELFILSPASLTAYNSAAPGFPGVPADAVGTVVNEALTVFKALFHGVCLLNGVAGLNAAAGFKPAGVQCADTGGNIFVSGGAAGTVLTEAQKTAGNTYATRIASAFLLDVMRIDVSAAPVQPAAAYGSVFCSTAGTVADILADNTATDDASAGKPLLCGGRNLADDVIDISYNYLLGGITVGVANGGGNTQFSLLMSDGVHYKQYASADVPVAADNPSSVTTAVNNLTTRTTQGHAAPTTSFPYAPAEY